jgi:hypothetical protein
LCDSALIGVPEPHRLIADASARSVGGIFIQTDNFKEPPLNSYAN